MKAQHVIVDGYNLLHHEPGSKGLATSQLMVEREKLIVRLSAVVGLLAERITVVFDGQDLPGEPPERELSAVEVIFSPVNQTADTVIERMAHRSAQPAGLLVVSSDHAERNTVSAIGVRTTSCTDFLELLRRTEAGLQRQATATHRRVPAPRLGDFFPKQME
ncbi:MAG: NYN domain-containing protein [Kiritimatiellaeota bacterium]|nr:NYN domain-containing protein [Kiritimatiellota bacterium]